MSIEQGVNSQGAPILTVTVDGVVQGEVLIPFDDRPLAERAAEAVEQARHLEDTAAERAARLADALAATTIVAHVVPKKEAAEIAKAVKEALDVPPVDVKRQPEP
jgi:hypothetical protein